MKEFTKNDTAFSESAMKRFSFSEHSLNHNGKAHIKKNRQKCLRTPLMPNI